jgi:hypothetical protein
MDEHNPGTRNPRSPSARLTVGGQEGMVAAAEAAPKFWKG